MLVSWVRSPSPSREDTLPRHLMLILAGLVAASAVPRGQRPPVLALDAGRTIVDHRGGGGRAYAIDSAILRETPEE